MTGTQEKRRAPPLGTVRVNLLEADRATLQRLLMTEHSQFRYFKTSPEVILFAVMLSVCFPPPPPSRKPWTN